MNAPDMRCTAKSKTQNLSQGMIIDSRRDCRYQHHRQSRCLTIVDGTDLYRRQRGAPEGTVNGILQTIKLQEHHADASLGQMLCVSFLLGDPDAVGVQLEERKALFLTQSDDRIQIVAHGGLAAGQLDIEGTTPLHQQVILFPNFFQRQIKRLLLSG